MMVNYHRLRWALLCVMATIGGLLAISAEASRTVVIQPGDSLDSLARKFRVSKRDIAVANGIALDAVLRDGKSLTIPDPPKAVKKPATMRTAAVIRGNRISVRMGPFEAYRRVALLDHSAPVTVTREAGEWYQIETESSKHGWVRSDFVSLKGEKAAARPSAERSSSPKRAASRSNDSDSRRKARAEDRRHSRRAARSNDESRARRRSARREEDSRRSHRRQASREYSRRHRYASSSGRRRSSPEAEAPPPSGDVIRTAYAYRGVRYRYGGSSNSGFDCSGFTSYVYRRQGVDLPHSASAQFSRGKQVNRGTLKKGDLVFFSTTRRGISHVGIYAGEGKFVHASSGGGRVRVDSLDAGYYKSRFRGARRVKDGGSEDSEE